jgi:universal stress protein E
MISKTTNRTYPSRSLPSARVAPQQRRVLCATDLSARSQHAVRAAIELSKRADAELILLHVLPKRADRSDQTLARVRLREQLRASGSAANSGTVLAVRAGDPARTLSDFAIEARADLIVMGAPRKRALASLTGTTAERVVSRTQRPVLIVRSKGTLQYERVVVAADLRRAFTDVLRFADDWSFFDRVPVSIVHAFQSPYQGPLYAEGYDVSGARAHVARWKSIARAHLLAKVNAADLDASRFDLRIEEARPLRAVRRALRHGGASLLILGTSGHTVLSRAFRGSLASDALLALEGDVLICATKTPRERLH